MSTTALNSLARASSAYLRSAMHQPVQWHEWDEDAFAEAKRDNKPILLDIGAVWCHWCHVMDRESYEDPEIAAIVNDKFVAIKVDRDERPDIDIRYQTAVQAVSGQGGWPLTAFLTPDGKPFYGGTYFPPADGYGRPSFRRVLLSISAAYHEKNGDVLDQAKMVESAIAQSDRSAGGTLSPSVIDQITESSLKMFDPENGGFGQAPKFPHPSALDLLLAQYVSGASSRRMAGDGDKLRRVIVTTLEHMARGGVYDQLAGGFHRYSVDERWVVPHFEKMSYDNSELLKNYVHAWQATGSEFFANVARDIIRWMDEWLSDRDHGGFYASQDADISLDDDGDYFTWTLDEARAVLTDDEARAAALHYDINEVGEMHHNPAKNVLYVRAGVEEIAKRMNIGPEKAERLLSSARKKMYAARLLRSTPYIDKTVYTNWNGMCVSAYLEAARALGLVEARQFALKSLDRILSGAWKPVAGASGGHELLHVVAYSDPEASHRSVPGLLDDYAATALACLDAYESTADMSYYRFARAITEVMINKFYDATGGGFFDTAESPDGISLGVLAARRKPVQDSPTPAGNPLAAIALLRMYDFSNEPSYREQAEDTLEAFAGVAGQYGMFAATYGLALARFLAPHTQVVVVEAEGDRAGAAELLAAASANFSLGRSLLYLKASEAVAPNLPPALAETIPGLPALGGARSFATLCSNNACQPPIFDPRELSAAMTHPTDSQQ